MKNEHFVNSQFQSLVIIPEHLGVIHVSTIFSDKYCRQNTPMQMTKT